MHRNAILPGWTRNPVARAELKHQRYVVDTNRAGRVWIGLALLLVVPGLLASVAFFVAALLTPFVPDAKYVLLWERVNGHLELYRDVLTRSPDAPESQP